jgi:predicted transcriptional regulator of viral defense system
MSMNYTSTKTLGPRTAKLIAELYERRRQTFTLRDICEITGLGEAAARSLVHKAQHRGLVTRLKPGMYNLVPFELGHATHHVGNPYLIARDSVGDASYFLSHATAFELHRMTTQPSFEIFVSSTKRFRAQTIGGYRYRFVLVPETKFFGVTTLWITKDQPVAVSDIDRTIIDGLRQSDYVGGITEVAKGLWMKRDKVTVARLVDYALRMRIGAVVCRLGFLLEQYELADEATLQSLRNRLTNTYHRLDASLPAEGRRIARWRLQLNVTPEEIDAVRFG